MDLKNHTLFTALLSRYKSCNKTSVLVFREIIKHYLNKTIQSTRKRLILRFGWNFYPASSSYKQWKPLIYFSNIFLFSQFTCSCWWTPPGSWLSRVTCKLSTKFSVSVSDTWVTCWIMSSVCIDTLRWSIPPPKPPHIGFWRNEIYFSLEKSQYK